LFQFRGALRDLSGGVLGLLLHGSQLLCLFLSHLCLFLRDLCAGFRCIRSLLGCLQSLLHGRKACFNAAHTGVSPD